MGARCSAELLREQISQVNVLPSEDCLDQFFRKGRNFAHHLCWEVGWGGLQVAEVTEVVEGAVVVVGTRYGWGCEGKRRREAQNGCTPGGAEGG